MTSFNHQLNFWKSFEAPSHVNSTVQEKNIRSEVAEEIYDKRNQIPNAGIHA